MVLSTCAAPAYASPVEPTPTVTVTETATPSPAPTVTETATPSPAPTVTTTAAPAEPTVDNVAVLESGLTGPQLLILTALALVIGLLGWIAVSTIGGS